MEVIHSFQPDTFLAIFEIGIRWASVTSFLDSWREEKKRRVRMGERRRLKTYVPSKSSLKVSSSAELASSILVIRKGKSGCDRGKEQRPIPPRAL